MDNLIDEFNSISFTEEDDIVDNFNNLSIKNKYTKDEYINIRLNSRLDIINNLNILHESKLKAKYLLTIVKYYFWINNAYVAYKILQILGHNDILYKIKIPRDYQMIINYDKIWKDICNLHCLEFISTY
jgi:hypothetical protein